MDGILKEAKLDSPSLLLQKRNQKSKHAIIFVAYELGALILKKVTSLNQKS